MSIGEHFKSIFDVYSQRNPALDQGDALEKFSQKARTRVLLFYNDLLKGRWERHPLGNQSQEFWSQMHKSLQYLYGRVKLSNAGTQGVVEDAVAFVHQCSPNEFFDFMELSFKLDVSGRVMKDDNDIVEALNEILRVENTPYHLTRSVKVEVKNSYTYSPYSGKTVTMRTVAYPRVVRSEEEMLHQEAIEPALDALNKPYFEAANLEFRDAMNDYRQGDYEDCLAKCGSAFESVLKVLCRRKGWNYSEDDNASKLIDVVFSRSTLEPFFKQTLMLISTMRNKLSSSHGGGSHVRNVEGHIAQYALTSSAAAIVLLVREIDMP